MAVSSGAPVHLRPSAIGLVFAGGTVGTLLRFGAEKLIPHAAGAPAWSTIAVNLIGSFVLGLLLEALVRSGPDEGWRRGARLLIGTGVCGGLTTYSTFALDTRGLLAGGAGVAATVYVVLTVAGGLLAAVAGIAAARRVVRA